LCDLNILADARRTDTVLQVSDQHAQRHAEDVREPVVVVEHGRPSFLREQVADGALRHPQALGQFSLRPALAL
jgi:hypothetical protein